MGEGLSDLEKKREALNKLAEKIGDLNEEDESLLQKISEEMDMLVIDYLKNNDYRF